MGVLIIITAFHISILGGIRLVSPTNCLAELTKDKIYTLFKEYNYNLTLQSNSVSCRFHPLEIDSSLSRCACKNRMHFSHRKNTQIYSSVYCVSKVCGYFERFRMLQLRENKLFTFCPLYLLYTLCYFNNPVSSNCSNHFYQHIYWSVLSWNLSGADLGGCSLKYDWGL